MKFIELTRIEGGRLLINTDNISSIYETKRFDRQVNKYVDIIRIQETTSEDSYWEVLETMDEIVALLKTLEENPILCAMCNDHIDGDGAICGVCAKTQDSIIKELQAQEEVENV